MEGMHPVESERFLLHFLLLKLWWHGPVNREPLLSCSPGLNSFVSNRLPNLPAFCERNLCNSERSFQVPGFSNEAVSTALEEP